MLKTECACAKNEMAMAPLESCDGLRYILEPAPVSGCACKKNKYRENSTISQIHNIY